MTEKHVAFIANSLENAYKFQRVFSELGVRVSAGSVAKMSSLFAPGSFFDLVVFEAIERASAYASEVQLIVEKYGIPLLVIVDERNLANVSLTDQVPSDFVLASAGHSECTARVLRLLGTIGIASTDETISVDDMVINMNTYQVTVEGEPVDMTYLEYALLAFLAQHPNRTFTRDALLQNVWGFDYFGGSRTVDVHVRRIRAKLGPGLAQHLKTIRGVGYLWNPEE
jgi:hypothetical protein